MRPYLALQCTILAAAAALGCRPPTAMTTGSGTDDTSTSGTSGGTGSSTAGVTEASTTVDYPTTGGPWELGPCNPIDPALCILPYPSLFHMRPASTPTGYQVALTEEALPVNVNGIGVDPKYLNEKDGFSTLGALLFYFPDVSLEGTIGHANLADYAAADAKTVLLDVDTGERVPHWVELDMAAPPSARLLMIYPATPLRHGARHVVGVRGLKTKGGAPVEPSPAFAALRDKVGTDDGSVEGQRVRYNLEVFPALAAAGFAREELQLAWDFVTVSRQNSLGRMLYMRDDVLDALGAEGPPYTVTLVEDEDCADPAVSIGRTVTLEMTVPLYTETDDPGALLTRDADGQPYRNGEKVVEVMVRIPCSLIDQPTPTFGRVVQYGHGLLGGKGEARNGYLSRMADEYGWVILASDWTGMKSEDTGAIAGALADNPSGFVTVPERSMQGFTEFIAAMRLATGPLLQEKALQFTAGDDTIYAPIDPTRRSYYGNSQGGILGGAYLALSPDIERGVLGVGGTPYVLLLARSADFDSFLAILKTHYTDPRDITVLIATFQNLWDPGETAGWAWALSKEPDPKVGPKQALLQVAIGDAQVTGLGAHIQARALGASTVAPQTRPIFGVAEKQPGFMGSALVEWKYSDVPDPPDENLPPPKATDPHECPRREPAAQQQLRDFLESGVVNQYCEGTCEGVRAVTCP